MRSPSRLKIFFSIVTLDGLFIFGRGVAHLGSGLYSVTVYIDTGKTLTHSNPIADEKMPMRCVYRN